MGKIKGSNNVAIIYMKQGVNTNYQTDLSDDVTQTVAYAWCIAVDILISPRGLSTLEQFMQKFVDISNIKMPEEEQKDLLRMIREELRRKSPLLVLRDFPVGLFAYYGEDIEVSRWADQKVDLRRHFIHIGRWIANTILQLKGNPNHVDAFNTHMALLVITLVHECFHMFRSIISLGRQSTPKPLSLELVRLNPLRPDFTTKGESGFWAEKAIFGGRAEHYRTGGDPSQVTVRLRPDNTQDFSLDMDSMKKIAHGDIDRDQDTGPLLAWDLNTARDLDPNDLDDPQFNTWQPATPPQRVSGTRLLVRDLNHIISQLF